MQPREDVIAVLAMDNREVEDLFSELERLSGTGDDEAKTLADQVVIQVVRHSVAEEQYLYPTVREDVPNGAALADRGMSENTAAEQTMKRLETMGPSDDDFWPTMAQLEAEIRQHIAGEEGDLFPRVREACPEDKLVDLGERVQQAKSTAPTGPRPSAADKLPGSKIFAAGAGLVDRIREALTGRGRGDDDKSPPKT